MSSGRRRHQDVALVLLCGGRAQRLGGIIKPLLTTEEGETILARLERAFSGAVAEVHVAASEVTAPAIRAATAAAVMIDPGRGPAAALARAATEARSPWILLAGGDQLHGTPAVLDRLVQARVAGCSAVVASVDGRRQPLLALYRRGAIVELAGRRSLEDTSLQALLDDLTVESLEADGWPEPLRRAFRSVNTPEEARAENLRL